MKTKDAKKLFRDLAKDHFGNSAMVIYANQSRTPKPTQPLVTLLVGKPARSSFAPQSVYDDVVTSFYPTGFEMTVDLFTNGADVYEEGVKIGCDDTSLDELFDFKDFLESEYAIEWCRQKDIAVIPEDPTPLTGIVNDSTYQYRARMTVKVCFTHMTAGVRNESAD